MTSTVGITRDLHRLLAEYASGADAVAAALAGATDAELDRRPSPGAWTAREIVHHLVDSEANAYVRLRFLLTSEDYTVQPWEQDDWVATPALGYDRPVGPALATFRALRDSSLELLRRLTPADLERAGTHPEFDEPYSIGLWLQLVAVHPHDHADQIRRARRGED